MKKMINVFVVIGMTLMVLSITLSGWLFPVYWREAPIIIGGTGGYYNDPIYLHYPSFTKTYDLYTLDDFKKLDCKTLNNIDKEIDSYSEFDRSWYYVNASWMVNGLINDRGCYR